MGLTKLILDHLEFSIKARYSVRIDQTIVVEPLIRITEDTFNRFLYDKPVIDCISIHNPDFPSLLTYKGPYTFERLNGLLIFKLC
ncbi:hypothetical protein [Halobacillus faecis]|uniref:Uncharacterized protein n=1 Tax=Halobacillus faecis TaxID=360184 RepID=A0A511WU60_9BACI|nr:hypothetical protein [Halobacillus faecis]GEN54447.1 hypothetical protein HFA01_27090 [Halobacillus faecis]